MVVALLYELDITPVFSDSCCCHSFKYSVYRHLGEYETVDQLRAGK